ncbi:MAG: hypothetical protein Tsb0014_22830 [Pleurocapsa sp.]
MSISLVITNFNGAEYLENAIASVLSQTRKDFELLIWDDGSTDNSLKIARQYQQRDSRIRIITATHQGLTKARKYATAATTGQYIGWLDSDDWLADTTLEETAKCLEQNPAIGMVYTDYYDVNGGGKVLGIGKRCQIPYSPQRLLVDFMTFHFRLMRREVYQQVGGIDTDFDYAQDYDLCLRFSEVTQIEKIAKPLYYYRHHGQNISYRQRKEQVQCSQKAIDRALQRRGLDNTYFLKVEGSRFCLKKKEQETNSTPLSNLFKKAATFLAAIPFTVALGLAPAQAQQIIPNNDGTMTVVTKDGNTFNIDGGSLSKDGKNLFHSFQEFGLDAGQIANFLSNPNIQNILTRINGGNPSLINGLIQVKGGNSNLFLMNPSGIIFGNNASLNVGGDFTATTATSIGLGTGWFDAFGTNDYLNLVGNPNSFDFEGTEAGTIINAGNLEVAEGSNISLTGGTVINTGTIESPGGNITVAAIPGSNRIRISQAGQILSLEIEVPSNESGEQLPVKVTDLPALLRGLPVDVETGLEVAENNNITVTENQTTVSNSAGTNIVSGNLNAAGGAINILGDKVGVIDANIDVSGIDGGGSVLIGGDYKGQGIVPNAEVTVVDSDSFINADALETGDGGKVIVWADETTIFAGNITARGGNESGNGGFVEVSGKENLAFRGDIDVSASQGNAGEVLLDPENIIIVDGDGGENDGELTGDNQIFVSASGGNANGTFFISEQALEGLVAADIHLEATNDITINDLSDNELTLQANTSYLRFKADFDNDGAGNFSMSTDDTLKTQGAWITITGANVTTGHINNISSLVREKNVSWDGDVQITATVGSVVTGSINTVGQNGYYKYPFPEDNPSVIYVYDGTNGGQVTITASENITTQNISSQGGTGANGIENAESFTVVSSSANDVVSGNDGTNGGNGGEITLTSDSGKITTGSVVSSGGAGGTGFDGGADGSAGTDGDITLTAPNTTEEITPPPPEDLPIVPAEDGTNSTVTAQNDGVTFDIEGGLTSSDNSNLFHSFSRFDLPESNQTANFIPNNPVTNILARVSSGDASDIKGKIQVTSSSNPNLFLMNPAGVIFGSTATLNVPGDLTVTTGNGLRVGDDWFSAAGNFTPVNGNPDAIAFTMDNPSTIINGGNLINNNGALNLVGGSVISSNDLESDGSTLASTLGQNILNPEDTSFSSIEENDSLPNSWDTENISYFSELIAEIGTDDNLGVTVSDSGNSQELQLSNSNLKITPGDVVIKSVTTDGGAIAINSGGKINAIGDLDSSTEQPSERNGGNVTLEAENEIKIASIDSSSDNSGGDIKITSNKGGIEVLSTQGIFSSATTGDGGDVTLTAENDLKLIGIVTGSEKANGGDISLTSQTGNIDATVSVPDTEVGEINFGLLVSGSAKNGGNITLKAPGDINTGYIYSGTFQAPEDNEFGEVLTGGTISLESSLGKIDTTVGINREFLDAAQNSNSDSSDGSNIAERMLSQLPEDAKNNSDFRLEDTILAGISSFSRNNSGAVKITTLGENQDITVGVINAESTDGDTGSVNIKTQRFFRAKDKFTSLISQVSLDDDETDDTPLSITPTSSISTFSPQGSAGDISITHGGNGKTPFTVGDATTNGTAGNISSNNFPFNTPDSFLFTERRANISLISINGFAKNIIDPGDFQNEPVQQQDIDSTATNFANSNLAIASIPEARQILMKVAQEAAQKPALVYVGFTSPEIAANETSDGSFANTESCRTAEYEGSLGLETNKAEPTLCIAPKPSDRLEILVITSEDEPILVNVDVTRQEVEKMAERLYREVSRPGGRYYKGPGKKLYEWLIGSIESELEEREIDNLLFIMPPKLRSLPIAALYDEKTEQYLVQKNYNVGFAPSLNLMDTRYKNIQESPVLAFGASDFEKDENQQPLPAVEIELPVINKIRGGNTILNQDFTLENLQQNLKENRAPIVHLSTHADFDPKNDENIYIQLYNRKLTLNQLRKLDLNAPTVELLVLSACRSAFGNTESELGFGGLAVKAGVKTAIGSLWYVGDTSTSALMSEFYHQLNTAPVKAKALREAQIAMIEGKVKTKDDAIATTWGEIPLPENLVNQSENAPDWSHPYYWAPFTIIGSPW